LSRSASAGRAFLFACRFPPQGVTVSGFKRFRLSYTSQSLIALSALSLTRYGYLFFLRSMAGRTIQDVIDSGDTIRAYCHAYQCNHSAVLDMIALRDRFGPDHGAMHDDLVPKLRCIKCGGKKVGIISTPGTKEYGGNPYLKSKGK